MADASQDGAPIPDNKCKICKGGVPTLIDDSGTEVTLSETFGLPNETVSKINEALDKLSVIGILAKVNLLEITGSIKTKECCVPRPATRDITQQARSQATSAASLWKEKYGLRAPILQLRSRLMCSAWPL